MVIIKVMTGSDRKGGPFSLFPYFYRKHLEFSKSDLKKIKSNNQTDFDYLNLHLNINRLKLT